MPLSRVVAALLCVMPLTACGHVMVAAPRSPDAGLLAPCDDPVLSTGSTDNDFAADLILLDEAYQACKQRQANLAKFVVGK